MRCELALTYASLEAAALRAKEILHLEPDVKVLPIQMLCPVSEYPFSWRAAND